MNKDNNLIKKFKEKVEELKKHNILYFNQDKPIISDAEYDNLKKELIKIEKSNKSIKRLNLLSDIVGAPRLINLKNLIIWNQCFLYQMLLIKMTWMIS